jgi:hypothetical protein
LNRAKGAEVSADYRKQRRVLGEEFRQTDRAEIEGIPLVYTVLNPTLESGIGADCCGRIEDVAETGGHAEPVVGTDIAWTARIVATVAGVIILW